MTSWTPPRIAQLAALRGEGLTYREVAERLEISRSAVASGLRNHVYKIPDDRRNHEGQRARRERNLSRRPDTVWSERYLTEPWTARCARRTVEKMLGQS